MAGSREGVGGAAIESSEYSDLLLYVTDVAVSVGSLLQASCSIGEGGGYGWEHGGIGSLALRLQGTNGEVSPEGLAAALALAFEASVPTLEGVLLGGKVMWTPTGNMCF